MSGSDPANLCLTPSTTQWQPRVGNTSFKLKTNMLLTFLITLLTIALFLALFVFRSWDDNRLTSWSWVFSDISVFTILFMLFLGIFLTYGLSNISLILDKLTYRPKTWLFMTAFIVSAIFWSEPEVIVDVSRYFIQAKYLELYGFIYFFSEWGKTITVWSDLPLVPFIYGVVFKIFGEYRIAIQIVNSLLFSGTVILTYQIGKTVWNETIGLYGGLLLLGLPYLLTQVPLMLVDVASMFFFTLALFTTIKAIKQGDIILLVFASVTIVLAMLSKYSVWLMLSVIPLIFLCHLNFGWKVIVLRAAVITLITALLIGIVLLWNYNLIVEQLKFLQNYQVPGLKRWGESFTSTFLFQIHPFISLAALFSIYVAIKNKDIKFIIISWLLLLVFVLEIRRARYLIVVFPMLVLMAAYGFNEIRNVKITRFIVSSIVVSAVIISLFAYLPFLQNTSAINLSQAGKYLDSLTTKNTDIIEVVTLPQQSSKVNPAVAIAVLDLFTQKTLVYHYDQDQIQQPDSIEKSSLRFTWEFKNPDFFLAADSVRQTAEKRTPLVIIFSHSNQIIPAQIVAKLQGYRLVKQFRVADKVFKYQTKICLYLPVSV